MKDLFLKILIVMVITELLKKSDINVTKLKSNIIFLGSDVNIG